VNIAKPLPALLILSVSVGLGAGYWLGHRVVEVSEAEYRSQLVSVSSETSILSHQLATMEWRRYNAMINRAIAGCRIDDEFAEASAFLHRLTGVDLPVDGDYFGMVPSAETPRGLKLIHDWYETHQDRLFWDHTHQEVRVREASD